METVLLKVIDIYKYFPLRRGLFRKQVMFIRAVDGVSFSIKNKETFVVVGESGSGKSTIAKIILKLLEPDKGRIVFDNKDVTHINNNELKWYRRNVQGLFQNPHTSLNPVMKVLDLVVEPAIELRNVDKDEAVDEALKLMESIGLSKELLRRYPSELSGGQAQRVALARALIVKPRLLVLDEPTSALDVSTQAQLLNLLKSIRDEYGLSYLLITHDMGVAKYMGDNIAVMYLGKIVEYGSTNIIFENPLHPYTQMLLSSVLEPGEEPIKTFNTIDESIIISSIDIPKGCRFHPRCPFAMDICKKEEPHLINIDKNHSIACWLIKE